MAADKMIQVILLGSHSDLVRNIDGEEVAGFEKSIHRAQVDVVGIAEIWMLPFEVLNSGIRGDARLRGFGADDGVLAIRLVPYRHHDHTGLRRLEAGAQLRAGLMHKPVSYPDRKSSQRVRGRHFRYPSRDFPAYALSSLQ